MRDIDIWRRFWPGLSVAALAPLVLGAFSTFAAVGFMADALEQGRLDPRALAVTVGFAAVAASLYPLIIARRRFWILGVLIALQVLVPQWVIHVYPMARQSITGDALASRLAVDGTGAILALIAGYILIMVFIGREGMRGVRTQTEMALAREIHGSLVPSISLAAPAWEIRGHSLPASEVGGDLVDAAWWAAGRSGFWPTSPATVSAPEC